MQGWVCTKCREPLGGSAFRALGRSYHLRCFSCGSCNASLQDGRFFASKPVPPSTEQIPLCDRCYGNTYLQKCATCGEHITSKEAVVACGKRFHPEHFVCALCKCPLGAKFYPHEGMPYCRQDIDRVTGRVATPPQTPPQQPWPSVDATPQSPPFREEEQQPSPLFSPPALMASVSSPVPAPVSLTASPLYRSTDELTPPALTPNRTPTFAVPPRPAIPRPVMSAASRPAPSSSAGQPLSSSAPAAGGAVVSTTHGAAGRVDSMPDMPSRPTTSPRQFNMPSPGSASSRSSSNLVLPPRPLKQVPAPASPSVTVPPSSPGLRARAQTEAFTDTTNSGARSSPFELGLATPRASAAPSVRLREDGRIVPQRRARRASLDKALERADSQTCLQCLQSFAELSPSGGGAGVDPRCPRCANQQRRSSTAGGVAPVVLPTHHESLDEYDLWMEQDKLGKLQWPKNATEEESLVRACGYPRELGSCEISPQDVDYRRIERVAPYYRQFLYAQEHDHYLVGLEDGKEPAILSVEAASAKRIGKHFMHRALLRTARGDERFLVQGSSKKAGKRPKAVHIRRSHEALRRDSVPLVLVTSASERATLASDLLHFEDRMRNKRFKIGVLYARPGQTSEDEFYGNETGSKAFEDFLLLLGQKVELKHHARFAGGLQTKEGAATGEYSIYTEFQGLEIMFHVATYIPFTPDDRQQVERKRHLGNDIVVIVFKDGSNGTDGFSASAISSHFNHTFVVVEPVATTGGTTTYKVGLVYKSGVRPSKPFLPHPPVFEANEAFRQWMLTKLINAEIASLYSPEFLSVLRRTRRELLREILERYDARLLKS